MTYVQRIVSAMLGVISLIRVAMTTSNPESNVIQPLGPKICDRHCSHRIGCSGYLYSPTDLSCRLVVGKSRSGQHSREDAYKPKLFYLKGTQKINENDNLTCARNSKIFRTRRRIVKCRYIPIRCSELGKYTRLLLLPASSRKGEARQFHPHNKSVATYPYIQITLCTGVAYIASKRKLLISSFKPLVIFFVSLDDKKKTIIRSKYVSGIAVDDEKQLVFLGAYNHGIDVMTTEGTKYRLLKTLRIPLGDMAIDCQKRVIYIVGIGKLILKLTYEGVSQGIIVKGCIGKAICLNSNGSVLYYTKSEQELTLFKMSLPNGIPSAISIPFTPYPFSVYVFSNELYLTPYNNRRKLSVLSDSGKQIRLIDTGYDSHVQYVFLCAIP